TARKSKIFWLDGNTFRVDGSKIGILKEGNEVGFCSLLQGHNSRRLETQVGLKVLRNFAHKTLEGELPDEKLGRFLVTTNLAECDRSGTEAMRLLHTTRGGLQGTWLKSVDE
ncbi:histone H3, partial [Lactifluus volemus]